MFIYSCTITCAAGYMLSFWLHFLQSGASDLDIGSRSSSVHSLPAVENAPPTRTAHADLKVAVKHITEVKEEIRKNGIEIGKLLDVHKAVAGHIAVLVHVICSIAKRFRVRQH